VGDGRGWHFPDYEQPGRTWSSETTWPGSGGGISANYAIPGWQQGINMITNQGSTTMRNIPDVAALADGVILIVADNGVQGRSEEQARLRQSGRVSPRLPISKRQRPGSRAWFYESCALCIGKGPSMPPGCTTSPPGTTPMAAA